MASLCAQSAYKAQSARVFRPLFEQALTDSSDMVREAAVDGLIYIDKARALSTLRKDFINDDSAVIRGKFIELAGEVGSAEDLAWLAEMIASAGGNESAWQAMLKIFRRSEAELVKSWIDKFNSQLITVKLSDEQMIALLEIAQRKAAGENKTQMDRVIRGKLATLYSKIGEFKRAAEHLGLLLAEADSHKDRDLILAKLLETYLRWPNVEQARELVANYLLEKDLEPNSVIIATLKSHFLRPQGGIEPNTVVSELAKIKTTEPRPKWEMQLQKWTEQFTKDINQGEKQSK